jgi:hypothetical protein
MTNVSMFELLLMKWGYDISFQIGSWEAKRRLEKGVFNVAQFDIYLNIVYQNGGLLSWSQQDI